MTLNKYGFDFWMTKSMVRSDFFLENAQDIDGEVVATVVCQTIEDEVSLLNASNADRTGIWKMPQSWQSFYVHTNVDSDYAFALDSEFSEGKVLDSARSFDVQLLMNIDGRILISAEDYSEAKNLLPTQVVNDLFDCIESNCDSDIIQLFNSGSVLHFEFESLDEEDDGEFDDDDE